MASGPDPEDGILLVLGSGKRLYREYLLASLAAHRVWLLDDGSVDWQLPYLVGHTVSPQVTAARLASWAGGLVREAERIAADHPVAGVLTYVEPLVLPTAQLAEGLGLPGLGVEGAGDCRDKHRTRLLLTGAGLHQPRFGLASGAAGIAPIAAETGYPAVVKPRGLGGSVGVIRIDGPQQVDDAHAAAGGAALRGNSRHRDGVLVEQMLTGSEISIDGIVQDGVYRPLFVARKTVTLAPFFEESAHLVDSADPLRTDPALLSMLRAAHTALGLRDGVTHTEVMLTADGPAVVEVNGRLGGDFIPLLGWRATGIDPGDVAARVAMGTPVPPAAQGPRKVVGVSFRYPAADGVVRGVRLPSPKDTPGLVAAGQLAPDGTLLRLPPRGYLSRAAYVMCEASDPEHCEHLLNEAAARVVLDMEPE